MPWVAALRPPGGGSRTKLLGSRAPLETDFFNEEYGLEVFPLSGPGTKNYTVDFPVDFEDRDVVEILADRSEIGAKEGGKRYVTHVQIERNHRHLRALKISASKELNDGKVPCEVCDLDMLGRYNMDVPIIECHHLFPLSELDGEEVETTLDDLALLCPSCHRAIHKLDDCSDLDELRRRLNR